MVTPSKDGPLAYYPCIVTTRAGDLLDRVYLVEAQSYFHVWGVWPEDDPGKESVAVSDVASIRESPTRIPPKIANRIYRAGESGMGYTVFTLVFSDGTRLPCVTGNAIDFVDYPAGKSLLDVVDVLLHEGRETAVLSNVGYAWCLYQGPQVGGFAPSPVRR